MPGKYIQPHQIQSYMKGRAIGHTQQESAQVANISERSGRRIETGQHQPQAGEKRKGRTRPDPLLGVWDNELEPMLVKEPKLEPIKNFLKNFEEPKIYLQTQLSPVKPDKKEIPDKLLFVPLSTALKPKSERNDLS